MTSVSVVVPCFNEEAVLAATFSRLYAALQSTGLPSEIVFVDDGSTDRTPEILRDLQGTHPMVRVVRL